jgi:hypothetical protein
MNERPPEPAAMPAPPPPPADDGKASGAMRALAVLLALIVGFGAAVVIAVMVDLGSSPRCDEVGGALAPTEDCYDISSTAKPISLVLGWVGGVLGVLAALAFLRLCILGVGGRLAAQLTGAAVVLSALAIAIG